MTTTEKNRNLEHLVEQKILEFFGDPDAGLELKKPFVVALRKRLSKKQKLTPLSVIARKYGIR